MPYVIRATIYAGQPFRYSEAMFAQPSAVYACERQANEIPAVTSVVVARSPGRGAPIHQRPSSLTWNGFGGDHPQTADLADGTDREMPRNAVWDFSRIPVSTVNRNQASRANAPSQFIAAPLPPGSERVTSPRAEVLRWLPAQARLTGPRTGERRPSVVSDVVTGPGHTMDATTQSWATAYVGSKAAGAVQPHTDAAAAASAAAVDAAAYTVGRHVVFAAGAFQPSTETGRRLLVHELHHVIQQGVRDPMRTDALKVLPDYDPAERSAAVVNDRCQLSVARQQAQPPAAAPAAVPLPSAEELTRRLVQAIGVWETNRGGTAPRPRESELQTVAGVRASMATVEQATMPYLVTALGQHSELRALATPPLTADEVTAAQTRINAVDALLRSVGASARAGTTADNFIQANAAQITAAGLSNDNVRTMFRAVALQATVTEAHERVEHQRPPPPGIS